jgi:hypothetical protein
MNPRERILAFCLIGVLVLVVGVFMVRQLYFVPLQEKEASIENLRQDIAAKNDQIRQARADRPRLDRWRQLSLPQDPDLARREYEKYLSALLVQSGFEPGSFSVTPRDPDTRSSPQIGKKPIYTCLNFIVLGPAKLESIVKFQEEFYNTGLTHRIKTLSIQRAGIGGGPQQQRPTDLELNMTIEALIVNGAPDRHYLLPNIDRRLVAADLMMALRGGPSGLGWMLWAAGPTGLGGPGNLAQPSRHYTAIANKNIFLGPPAETPKITEPIEVARFVYLTKISHDSQYQEASLWDQINLRITRLRCAPGFDQFRITDDDGEVVVQGKVLRISERDLVFGVGNRYYMMHIGQNIYDALQQPMTGDEVGALTDSPMKGLVKD